MKALVLPAGVQKSHLNNFVKDSNNNYTNWTIGNESYSTLVENSFVKTSPPCPITLHQIPTRLPIAISADF